MNRRQPCFKQWEDVALGEPVKRVHHRIANDRVCHHIPIPYPDPRALCCQANAQRKTLPLAFGFFTFGNILKDADDADDLAVRCPFGPTATNDVAITAIGVGDPRFKGHRGSVR